MKKLICRAVFACLFIPVSSYAVIDIDPVNIDLGVDPILISAPTNPDLVAINGFYDLLSNQDTDAAILKEHAAPVVAAKWDVTPTPLGGPGLDGFAKTFSTYHKAIPNMTWKPQSILRSGHTYTVRSIGSGTPVFDFLKIGASFIPVTVTETVKTQLTDSQVSAFKAWQLAGDNFNTHYKLAKEGNTTEKEGMKALATEYMKQTKAYVYDGTFTESQKPLVYAYYDDAVTDSLKKLGLDGSHKEGLDYVPFDGYRAELHKGERVITAQDNKLLSAKDDRALIEQLKQQNKNLEVIIKQLKASHATDGYAYQKLIDGTDKQNEKLDGMARKARLVGA